MRIALLSNPSSGRGRHAAADDVARRLLTEADHEVLHVRGSSYEQARRAGRALLGDGPNRNVEALVVVGGDGMVHLGVDIVATTGVPLGIVATGTGNDIARHFGLPSRDAAASARLINQALSGEGAITAVDAIYASRPDGTLLAPERRWSLAVVSAGVDAAVNARANTLSWPAREGRYVRAFTAELATLARPTDTGSPPTRARGRGRRSCWRWPTPVTSAAAWTWHPRRTPPMACWRYCAWTPWAAPTYSPSSAGSSAART